MDIPQVVLKPGREKSLYRYHPWVFSGAIARVRGQPSPGETVGVYAHSGEWLAWGAWSPQSQIAVRVWSFQPDDRLDRQWWRTRIHQALARREPFAQQPDLDSYRLIYAEADGLPGVILDRYGEVLVLQLLSWGAEYWRETLVEALRERYPRATIYERSDAESRTKEGLPLRAGLIHGPEPPELVPIQEYHNRFWVDVRQGHKTGFYLDQRENRRVVQTYCRGGEALNCFAYTGGFTVSLLRAGCQHVTQIDSSARALDIALKNVALNGFDNRCVTSVVGDVFQLLRRYRDEGRTFDHIILDPPKFADAQAQVPKAARGYKDINLLAMKLLKPGGLLVTFSCSGLVNADLFQKILAAAAIDSGRTVHLLQPLGQPWDHPINLWVPEGAYLKGWVCQVT
ncbi:MAG: class I SAM-dependent methyltransferase [Gloeomargarita sp. SKYBB_i_bin120]|nr:class I SAM-dependent methyltransferase [Gloeomargarita sp. SKYG98]MCS7293042.1 class I SAM-dependent methyltransferase [Gloeomargarita sp. SKYB120]MDW8178607.1 class I SAM-dependent methyltransferase [Gloeomargarita sp. SKYBB_i_bin120]